jgi:sugar (pentulose or hexulose) kinase
LAGTGLQAGELSINVSTGSQVAMMTDDVLVGDFQLRPYFDDRYLKTVTNIPAGRALAALVRLLTEIPAAQGVVPDDAWAYAFQQAEALETTDLRTNLAFFPAAVPGPGQLSNLLEGNLTVGHVFRVALTQMAEYYETFATRLAPERSWTRLVFSGGIAQRSALLRRLICDRLGADHRLTASSEDTLLGLMVLARVISGLNTTVQDACRLIASV